MRSILQKPKSGPHPVVGPPRAQNQLFHCSPLLDFGQIWKSILGFRIVAGNCAETAVANGGCDAYDDLCSWSGLDGRCGPLLGDDRGKSGLLRARWWVTPTVCEDRESATESKPPTWISVWPYGESLFSGKGETVR